MLKIKNIKLVSFALFCFFLLSCQEDDKDVIISEFNLDVQIEHYFNDKLIEFDTETYFNEFGNELSVSKLRYLICDIRLTDDFGNIKHFENQYVYIDASKNRDTFTLFGIDAGNYTNLTYNIGVDSATNHQDPTFFDADHPLSLILHNLHWGWIDGYIFFSLEGNLHYQGNKQLYTYHLGFDRNLKTISLDKDFRIEENSKLELKFDLAKLFIEPNLIDQSIEPFITHSTNDNGYSDRLIQNLQNTFSLEGILE